MERVFFFARRWSQLSTSVISPSLNLVTHQVLRYLSSGVTFEVMLFFFPFVSLLPAVQRKTLTEMPTVTSLSQRMKEWYVFNCLHTTLPLFSGFHSLHSYHDSPPRCRLRGRHVSRAFCAGQPDKIWRKRQQESKVVQARRERGDDYQGFK